MSVAATLFAVLLSLSIVGPPKGQTESTEALRVRLESIADDASAVAKTDADALLILAVAEHESGFALNVDRGPCRPGTCDNGQAACMMQIHANAERRAELFADRRECFRVALAALHSSAVACKSLPPEERFAAYASGGCISTAGRKSSRELFALWRKWRSRFERAKK